MRSAGIILAVAALNLGGLGQTVGQGYKLDYPKQAFGFRGTLSGQIAKAPDPVYGWFEMKVIKVVSFTRGNKTRTRSPQALTKVWKDKYVAVLGVKGMEALKVGDKVTVVVFNREVHLRATKVSKDKPPDGDATGASREQNTQQDATHAKKEGAEKRGKVAAAKLSLIKTGYLETGKPDLVGKGIVRLKQFLKDYGDTPSASEARRLLKMFAE